MVHKKDVNNCIELITICLNNLDKNNWSF